MKEKNVKLDFIKIKIFCFAIKKMKRQATDWEKIFAKHISVKELVSKINEELKLNRKINNTI